MFKLVIAVVLLAHGVEGHSMGLLQIFKVATVNPSWQGNSWLLSGAFGTTLTQVVGSLLWATALVGFSAVAGVVIGWLPAAWFPTLAVVSAVASLIGLVLFPAAFPSFSTIGAFVIDVVVLAAVWYHWLPADLTA